MYRYGKNIEALKERNIPHIIFNANSLEEIAQDLLTLGKACQVEEQAKTIAEEYMHSIEKCIPLHKQFRRNLPCIGNGGRTLFSLLGK